MKNDKGSKAPHILLMTKRFNDVSRLVASEILRQPEQNARITVIEKWAAVADISRCLHNFNGVLQICSAFTNSAVYRLKKTWEKVSKTVSRLIVLFCFFYICKEKYEICNHAPPPKRVALYMDGPPQ